MIPISDDLEIRCKICHKLVKRVRKSKYFFCRICQKQIAISDCNIRPIRIGQKQIGDYVHGKSI